MMAGCSWRLQGSMKLSPVMAATAIDTRDHYTRFQPGVGRKILGLSGQTNSEKAKRRTVVKVVKDESRRRVLDLCGIAIRPKDLKCSTDRYSVDEAHRGG